MQIFLSYARQDEKHVKVIFDFLRAAGHDPWMDVVKLVGGIEFEVEIIRQITRSDMFFVFLSRNSAGKRGIIQKEIRTALEKAQEYLPGDIFIVPILLDDCEVPDALKKYHWVDTRDPNWKVLLTQTLSSAEQQRVSPPAGTTHLTYENLQKMLGSNLTSATAIELIDSDKPAAFWKFPWIVLTGVAALLIGTNALVTTISALVALLLGIVALLILGVLSFSGRIRGDNFLLAGTIIITIGAVASITINFSRLTNNAREPVKIVQERTQNAPQRELTESLAAIEACNDELTFECMQAGGVRTAAAAGRHFTACKTAELLRSDQAPLQWKDVWTTSVYSYAPGGGGPGGGLDDDVLKIGGWGDEYYSLIKFTLPSLAYRPRFAAIILYSNDSEVASTRLAVDRIVQPWDFPKGDRLWWKDKPRTIPTDMRALPAPGRKQWYMIELTGLIDGWRDGRLPNYGIQITPLESNNNYAFFASSDAADKRRIPRLLFCP